MRRSLVGNKSPATRDLENPRKARRHKIAAQDRQQLEITQHPTPNSTQQTNCKYPGCQGMQKAVQKKSTIKHDMYQVRMYEVPGIKNTEHASYHHYDTHILGHPVAPKLHDHCGAKTQLPSYHNRLLSLTCRLWVTR